MQVSFITLLLKILCVWLKRKTTAVKVPLKLQTWRAMKLKNAKLKQQIYQIDMYVDKTDMLEMG